ncbi:E3 ubiquitin-protein ligase RNF25 [Quillaja saponaria]|uniref:E3 ubiquitin-protein ligase RNF25 n=1 Tax=Quillaja saponaria TaxID=32244 RepID=A0AAD7PCS6_QUISA|nr:E3 ubiquitin-protein ligase RNF25 [Quillaja saponaria]
MAAEEEVLAEIEAVQAVYGSDCLVLDSFPPHLHVFLKPRTADVSSQQFVEAVIQIQAGSQYPKEPPHISLLDSKGLDGQRQKHLINYIQDKACELSPCLMLVALCEEAVEKLSDMNHPDGECPLCLYPLVPEDQQTTVLPFMKLMSCFHCFHSECIIQWWNWLQNMKEANSADSSCTTLHPTTDRLNQKGTMKESIGNCPVCRKVFQAKDLEHVLDLVGSHSSQLSFGDTKVSDDDNILQSESEITRRQKFEAVLKIQEGNSGIIQPKKDLVVLPGMFLPQPVTTPTTVLTKDSTEQFQSDRPVFISKTPSTRTSNGSSSSRPNNFGTGKQIVQLTKRPAKQWVKKVNGTAQ